MSAIRIATASPATRPTRAATLAQLADVARRAARNKADLLLLPEAYIGGYPRGTAFGCVMGDRSEQGRDEFARYFDAAADLGDTVGNGAGAGARWLRRELGGGGGGDGDAVRGDGTREELERIASDTGLFVVVGCVEKAGGSLYCTVVYVCPREGVVGKRRKVMPTATERLVWAQGCPSTLRAVSTTIRGTRVNLAAAICWENYMPLLRQSLYAQNINLYLAPTADSRDTWLSLMRTIAIEGRCFVVSSNMCVRAAANHTPDSLHRPPRPKRRMSVFDEDGNEIVLCCDGDGEPDARAAPSTAIAEDDASDSLAHPSPSPQRPRRRMSVFDEDGNEIVLPCDRDHKNRAKDTADVDGPVMDKAAPFVSRGGSSIVSPFGQVLAGPQWDDDEGIIYADIDMRECVRGRLDLDTAGSYSRGDSFKLSVQGLDMDPLPY